MKLLEALEIAKRPVAESAPGMKIFLATGVTPLHLQTFLHAHLRLAFPDAKPEIATGLFGDLIGNLVRLDFSSIDALAIVIEWSDLDPRLGIRALGGWRPESLADIVASAAETSGRMQQAIESIARHIPTVVSMPTLPLPPLFTTRPLQSGSFESQLQATAAMAAENLAQLPGIRLVSAQQLALVSAPADRHDVKADVASGFPYTLRHASSLAEMLAGLIRNRTPMKGLITDLDDTLWSGIVGDDGVDSISWSLDAHTQMHGLYQQVLSSLAGAGVLIGVASKNDPEIVREAFERKDLLLSRNDIFPFEVHWSPKSESVRRILAAWNIGADAVLFIDDNPMEVAEVKAAFPEMDCRLFPKNDYPAILSLLKDLRDVFGKPMVTGEDALRLKSLRDAGAWQSESGPTKTADDFLAAADACITFEGGQTRDDARALELVNKTNQFNLNGIRLTESAWRKFFDDPSAFLLTASYQDKFGPLGKVAVVMGRVTGKTVHVSSWVMSCRAFSRRLEHQCLKYLFENLEAEELVLDYETTPRNGPLQDFLEEMIQQPPAPGLRLTRDAFFAAAPALFHRIEVTVNV